MLGFFGQYLVESGIIDYLQLDLGLGLMNERNRRFGEIAMAESRLGPSDADALHERQRTQDKYFGELAVEAGFLAQDDIPRILDQQRREHLRIGEALTQLGVLSRDDVEHAFGRFSAEQSAPSLVPSVSPSGPYESLAAHLKSHLPRRIQRVFGEPAKLGGTEPLRPMARFELQASLPASVGLMVGIDAQRRWLRGMHLTRSRDSEAYATEEIIRSVATELLRTVALTAEGFDEGAARSAAVAEPVFGELPLRGMAVSLVTPHGRALLALSKSE